MAAHKNSTFWLYWKLENIILKYWGLNDVTCSHLVTKAVISSQPLIYLNSFTKVAPLFGEVVIREKNVNLALASVVDFLFYFKLYITGVFN